MSQQMNKETSLINTLFEYLTNIFVKIKNY